MVIDFYRGTSAIILWEELKGVNTFSSDTSFVSLLFFIVFFFYFFWLEKPYNIYDNMTFGFLHCYHFFWQSIQVLKNKEILNYKTSI